MKRSVLILSLAAFVLSSNAQVLKSNLLNGYKQGDKLEKATLKTIEDGKMTKDLALITELKDVTVLNSEGFIKAIRETMDAM